MKTDIIDFPIEPLWKISELRRLLKKHGILRPVPTHQTIINYILDGTLDGFQTDRGHYLIREKSILAWVRSLQQYDS